MMRPAVTLATIALLAGCSAPAPSAQAGDPIVVLGQIDSARVVSDHYFLSHPALEGRLVGTPGNDAAREYIISELMRAGVQPLAGEWRHTFEARGGAEGVNVLGVIPGSERPGRYIVATAHFDHLGLRDGEIYYGADDNASGSAALLEIARYFAANPPSYSIVIAALDAEEGGLLGARAFIDNPMIPLDSIVMNVNMDMISRNEADELYAAGTYHYPFLIPIVEEVADRAPLTLLRGHDDPSLPPGDDWTSASDHGPFHAAGIPFIYFGVEDHPDYHQPTDVFENTDPGFFVRAVRTVLDFIESADERAEEVIAGSGR